MPVFRFTSPTGEKFRVTAPEGATEAEAFSMLQQSQSTPSPKVADTANLRAMENQMAPAAAAESQRLADVEGYRTGSHRGTGEVGTVEGLVGGAKQRWDEAAAGLEGAVRGAASRVLPTGMVSPDLAPETRQRLQQGRQWREQAGMPATVGGIGFDMAATAPLAAAAPLAAVAGRFGPLAADVAGQAAYGALTTSEDRGSAAGMGAGGAAAGRVLAKALGGAARAPGGISPEARALQDAGVSLTPGQARGAGSMTGKIEEWAASNPIAALAVNPARRRAAVEAQSALVDAAVGRVGGQIKRGVPAREAIDGGYDAVSGAYQKALKDAAFDNSEGFIVDEAQALAGLAEMSNPLISPKHVKELQSYVKGLEHRIEPRMVRGDELKQIDAEIGHMARQLEKSLDPRDKLAARSWREFQQGWREHVLGRALKTPEQAELLGRANQGYKELLALDKALGQNEFMLPRRAANKLREAAPGSRAHALAKAMEKTLPNTVPNSGTPERLIAALLPGALMGGGAGLSALGDPMGLGTVGLAAGAAMSRPGTRALMGQLPGQAGMRAATPYISALGASMARPAPVTQAEKEEQLRRVLEQAAMIAEQQ